MGVTCSAFLHGRSSDSPHASSDGGCAMLPVQAIPLLRLDRLSPALCRGEHIPVVSFDGGAADRSSGGTHASRRPGICNRSCRRDRRLRRDKSVWRVQCCCARPCGSGSRHRLLCVGNAWRGRLDATAPAATTSPARDAAVWRSCHKRDSDGSSGGGCESSAHSADQGRVRRERSDRGRTSRGRLRPWSSSYSEEINS